MAAFSGFWESPGPPPLGDVRGILPAHRHGHRNGQQSRYILHHCFVCLSWKCRQHVATCRHDVAPILARWVRVADTTLKMSWQFVSAWADIYQIEIYYGMGVHTHKYYRTHMLKVVGDKFVMFSPVGLSCSPSLSCSPTDYATDACSLRCIFATFLADSTSLDHTSTSSSPIGKLD